MRTLKIKTLFLIVFILQMGVLYSQDTLNSAIVEQKSYQLYSNKNWSELIKFGNKSVRSGYDYFYLQMRIGIAYYEQKNYCLAEGHFKKALKFNSDDELALEYLYYCLLFTGKYDHAKLLSKKFTHDLSVKTNTTKKSPINFLMIEAGTKISDSSTYYDVGRKKENNYFNPATYLQVGLGHTIQKSFSLFHAFTYFNQQSFVGTARQLQYYLKASIPIKNNWTISPAIHIVNLNFTSDNPPPPKPPFPGMPPPVLQTTVTTSNYFIGSLNIQKNYKKFGFAIGSTYSNMSNVTQFIHSGFASYSVLGNSKLVLGCTGYLHTIDNYGTINTSLSPFIYIQPITYFSLKTSYLLNNGHNIIEDNGYLVNNSPDLTKSRWSFLATMNINKNLSIYGLYQLENKTENIQMFNYKYNIFVGGIKITP